MRSGCDAQRLLRRDIIFTTIFKTRDSRTSQCMQCLISPDDATGHQNFTLNLVTALNITASFFIATCNSHYFCFLCTFYALKVVHFPVSDIYTLPVYISNFSHIHPMVKIMDKIWHVERMQKKIDLALDSDQSRTLRNFGFQRRRESLICPCRHSSLRLIISNCSGSLLTSAALQFVVCFTKSTEYKPISTKRYL